MKPFSQKTVRKFGEEHPTKLRKRVQRAKKLKGKRTHKTRTRPVPVMA